MIMNNNFLWINKTKRCDFFSGDVRVLWWNCIHLTTLVASMTSAKLLYNSHVELPEPVSELSVVGSIPVVWPETQAPSKIQWKNEISTALVLELGLLLGPPLIAKKLMLWSNVHMYSYKNNFIIIDIAAEFIKRDKYYVLSMCMYVLKFETVSSYYLIQKSWKHFDIMIKCFTRQRK